MTRVRFVFILISLALAIASVFSAEQSVKLIGTTQSISGVYKGEPIELFNASLLMKSTCHKLEYEGSCKYFNQIILDEGENISIRRNNEFKLIIDITNPNNHELDRSVVTEVNNTIYLRLGLLDLEVGDFFSSDIGFRENNQFVLSSADMTFSSRSLLTDNFYNIKKSRKVNNGEKFYLDDPQTKSSVSLIISPKSNLIDFISRSLSGTLRIKSVDGAGEKVYLSIYEKITHDPKISVFWGVFIFLVGLPLFIKKKILSNE